MATAKLESIQNLYDKSFYIPSYQRGYRWEKTQVEELIGDLYEFAQNKPQDDDYYCLQPIVVKQRTDLGEKTWEVIDGQQRLTAMWFITLIIDILENSSFTKTYSLEYERKEKLSNIFKSIDKLSEIHEGDLTYQRLINLCNDESIILDRELPPIFHQMSDCIDGIYLRMTFDAVFNYGCEAINENIDREKNKRLRQYYTYANSIGDVIKRDKVKVIWYEIESENAIETFLDLNANKIELTNAELLKAKLFHTSDDENRRFMAMQWENIERGLHDSTFWNFIANKEFSSGKYKDATRIDYLFSIYLASHKDVTLNTVDDRYGIFRKINEIIHTDENPNIATDELWREILNIYETLQDWYSDYFYYHTIGLLITFEGIEKIKELYSLYEKSSKDIFRGTLVNHIKKRYTGKKYFDNQEIGTVSIIKNKLNNLRYADEEKKVIKDILLLYNIATLVNAENTYERFPFELYKNDIWDIEHIVPQQPEENADSNVKLDWIKENFPDKLKENEHITLFYDGPVEEAELDSHISNLFDVDQFGNLTLLDSSTNRSYKNKPFSQKRDIIIKIIRNEGDSKILKYVCAGTKWVFLKGHLVEELADRGRISYWSQADVDSYTDDVANRIFNFFELSRKAGSK